MRRQILLGIIIGVYEVLVGNNTFADDFWVCAARRGIVAQNISSSGLIFIGESGSLIATANLPEVAIREQCQNSDIMNLILAS